jgi:hypothetical protein
MLILPHSRGYVQEISVIKRCFPLYYVPTDGSVEERYEMFGDGFRVDVCAGTNPHPRLRCWKDDDLVVDEHPPEEQPLFVRVGAYAEIEEFATALTEGRAPWPSVAEVYPSVEIAFRLDPGKPES